MPQTKEIPGRPDVPDPLSDDPGQSLIEEATSYFISAYLGFLRNQTLDLPEFVIRKHQEMLDSRSRMMSLLARMSNSSPSALVASRIEKITAQMDRGYFPQLTLFGDLDRNDRKTLAEIKLKLVQGEIVFLSPTREEEKRLAEIPKRRKIWAEISQNKYLSPVGKWVSQNRWIKIHPEEDSDLLAFGSRIGIPLLPGRNINITVGKWDKRVFPEAAYSPDPIAIDIQTLPVSNSLLYHSTPPHNHDRVRKSSIPKETSPTPQMELLKLNLGLLRVYKNLGFKIPCFELPPRLLTKTRSVIEGSFKFPSPDKVGAFSLNLILSRLYNSIGRIATGERVPSEHAFDLDWLLNRITSEGNLPGDCKSIATVSASCLLSLGLPGRIMEGFTVDEKTGKSVGHVWPEVYIPSLSYWIPFDPANGIFYSYPSLNQIYVASTTIYPRPRHPVSLMVSFSKSS